MDSPKPSPKHIDESENSDTTACTDLNQEGALYEASKEVILNYVKHIIPPSANVIEVESGGDSCSYSQQKLNEDVETLGGIIDGHKAVVLDQVILVKALKQDSVKMIDEKTGKLNCNEYSDASSAKPDVQEVNCAEQVMQVEPSEITSDMMVDEQNSEIFQKFTNQEKATDIILISTPKLENFCTDKPLADFQPQNLAGLTSNPSNTADESEKRIVKNFSTDNVPPDNVSVLISNSANTADGSENDTDHKPSSLALLAQYDTDSNSDDDVCEVPIAESYQNRCVEIDSDSSTSDVEFLSENHGPINLETLEADLDEEDDEENIRSNRQPKVKGELHLDDLPPIEDLHITVPEDECTELGKIHSIVEQLVIVDALPGTVPLDLETVLFRDKGKQVLGEIFDVLGQVSDPLYCVRFNSNKEIKEKGIAVGQTVYVAPRTEHTQFVILANLMKVRGSDASWENDVEPPPRFIDYSDDEEERSARRPNRKRQCPVGNTYAGRGSYIPRRPYRGNYSGRGIRQPHHQPPVNYNLVGNSWHSNFHQPPNFNHHPQYRMPTHSAGGYRPPMNNTPYQQPPVNPGLVINPYAVYPTSQAMQQPLFPPQIHQPPPPPPQ